MQGVMGLIPGKGTKISHATGQLSPHTTTTEPKPSRACIPQLEGSQHTTTKDLMVPQLRLDAAKYCEAARRSSRPPAARSCSPVYDLTWKDNGPYLGQTLTPDSKIRVLGKAVAYGD